MIMWKGKHDLRVPMSPCEEGTEDPSLAAMDGCIFLTAISSPPVVKHLSVNLIFDTNGFQKSLNSLNSLKSS